MPASTISGFIIIPEPPPKGMSSTLPCLLEKSLKLSTNWAVFEPNDVNTWTRVKGMIENYLTNLWKQGALAGATPDAAFFVNIGLGTTMSQVDILEGRMNVEIGMAAVRPAEFIVLKFSHKLQES